MAARRLRVRIPTHHAGELSLAVGARDLADVRRAVVLFDDEVLVAKGRDLRLGVGRTFLGLDKDGTPVTLSADAPLSLRQAVLVYDGEAKTYTLLPGSSQELCYLGDTALLEPQELAGEETLRLGTATLKFVPFCGPDFSW